VNRWNSRREVQFRGSSCAASCEIRFSGLTENHFKIALTGISVCRGKGQMTEVEEQKKRAEQKITDELAQQPKNGEDTEGSKQRRADAEKELNESRQPQGNTKN
jgi:hypothetical protein